MEWELFSDAEIRTRAPCYGLRTDPKEPDCQSCPVRDRCWAVFAKSTIPQAAEALELSGPEVLADHLGADKDLVAYALQVRSHGNLMFPSPSPEGVYFEAYPDFDSFSLKELRAYAKAKDINLRGLRIRSRIQALIEEAMPPAHWEEVEGLSIDLSNLKSRLQQWPKWMKPLVSPPGGPPVYQLQVYISSLESWALIVAETSQRKLPPGIMEIVVGDQPLPKDIQNALVRL